MSRIPALSLALLLALAPLAAGQAAVAIENARLFEKAEAAAVVAERNRLARDLHDSVKQQAFATTMTLGTAKAWRERDPEAAWEMIDEAVQEADEETRAEGGASAPSDLTPSQL